MLEVSNVRLPLDAGLPGEGGHVLVCKAAAAALGVRRCDVASARVLKRSVDARKKRDVHFVATLGVELHDAALEEGALAAAAARGGANDSGARGGASASAFRDGDGAPVAGGRRGAAMARGRDDASAVGDGLEIALVRGGVDALPGTRVKKHAPYEPLVPPKCAESLAASGEPRPIVVGAGPAGLFCALYLARAGLKPLVLERGGNVDERMAAVAAFDAGADLNPQTNIQFGEGGAGTFSDGKLTTNIKNPLARHVLHWFVEAGAPEDILWQAKPHIGTDLLVEVVRTLRRQIEEAGGTVRFHAQLDGLCFDVDGALSGVYVRNVCGGAREHVAARRVVLACGHSARDTFELVYASGVFMQQKPFSVGVRIEHRQSAIDRAQYGEAAGHPALGAADYKLAVHLPARPDRRERCREGQRRKRRPAGDGRTAIGNCREGNSADVRGAAAPCPPRGVYTFCMCPGGQVVCAASEEGGVVVNGMSRFARDGENANSALLVGVDPEDFDSAHPLAGVDLQRDMEQAAYRAARAAGGAPYAAPAQTVGDFLAKHAGGASATVCPTYARGVVWCNLWECLPDFVAEALAEALPLLDRKLRGFADRDAVMTGVETRSSSPVRIVRDATLQAQLTEKSPQGTGLYPCGEGAGYAGGIMSAACDGLRVAQAIASAFA